MSKLIVGYRTKALTAAAVMLSSAASEGCSQGVSLTFGLLSCRMRFLVERMTANQAWFTAKGLCLWCGETLMVKGTEAELLEGMEVRCPCGKLYRLRWKRQLRGGRGGFVQRAREDPRVQRQAPGRTEGLLDCLSKEAKGDVKVFQHRADSLGPSEVRVQGTQSRVEELGEGIQVDDGRLGHWSPPRNSGERSICHRRLRCHGVVRWLQVLRFFQEDGSRRFQLPAQCWEEVRRTSTCSRLNREAEPF